MIWMGEIFKVVQFLLQKPAFEKRIEAWDMIDMMEVLLQNPLNGVVIINVVHVCVETSVGLIIEVRDQDHVILIVDALVLLPVGVHHHSVVDVPLHQLVAVLHLLNDQLTAKKSVRLHSVLLNVPLNNNGLMIVNLQNLLVVVLLNLLVVLLAVVLPNVVALRHLKINPLQNLINLVPLLLKSKHHIHRLNKGEVIPFLQKIAHLLPIKIEVLSFFFFRKNILSTFQAQTSLTT